MSTINYTYNVIVDRFRQFAAGHFQLRRFTHGEISQADLEKEAEWPWLHVKPRAINYSPGTRAFQFEIFISDLPRDKEDKTGYQAESITDCSLIFQDLINEIYLGNMFGTDAVLTRPVNSEPFVEQYTHTLTGVTGTIELQLDYDWSACSIPASWNYNTPTDSGSDGWGALQFIESLDQNGVYVSLLNDEETPGNSYYYGTDEAGVKGWHAIVDNIGLTCETLPDCATIISIVDDIAALQTDKVDKVAGKGLSTEDYTTAEKSKLAGIQAGAEVNVNADWNAVSGDAQILNKPSIPAAQVNSDWNATSGVAQIFNKPTIPSIAGLVPETRTITINGTTQDLSANRTFTIATGLTVGTTPITSGTVGRVLFEGTGNVLQQSGSLFWDDTNNRLGIGTATPSFKLDVVGGDARFNSVRVGLGGGNVADNTALGESALNLNTSGSGNLAISYFALSANITGSNNTAVGSYALRNNTQSNNTAMGYSSFLNLSTGTLNIALGRQAARYIADGSTSLTIANQSIFIGADTKALANSQTNQIVIGYNAIGLGSNSVVLGNSSITLTALRGNVLINTTTDAGFRLDVNGSVRATGSISAASAIARGLFVSNTLIATANNDVLAGLDVAPTFTVGAFTGVQQESLVVRGGGNVLMRFKNSTATATWGQISATISSFSLNAQAGLLSFVAGNTEAINVIASTRNVVVQNGGTFTDTASAQLSINSTTRGFLPPRMTTTQKNAIASPATGLMVYDTTLNLISVYNGTMWISL